MPARLSIEDINLEFNKVSYELLSTEYKNQHESLKYKCSCGKINYISYKSFRAGKRCNYCKPILESQLVGIKAYTEQKNLNMKMLNNRMMMIIAYYFLMNIKTILQICGFFANVVN